MIGIGMDIERLFELAGVSNNEILLEAVYDNMVTKLKNDYPNKITEIDYNIKQAKDILKKSDRIVWYIKVLRAYLSNNINSVNGDYNFKDMESFNNDLFGYYKHYNLANIENTQFNNQSISELFGIFENYITEYKKSPKAPVPVQHGDYELIKCNDGNSWWFINRSFCEEEGRSGQHCGNVNGKKDTTQRIISLRTPKHNVILTFILLKNEYLGEMKAKANQKPDVKYHPNIMQLLLNPMIKGIRASGHERDMNFSIFDLSEQNINALIQHGKESFIIDQVKMDPTDLLTAPAYIKTLPDAWEQAIIKEPKLILRAPDNIKDFQPRVIKYLKKYPASLLHAPISVAENMDIIKPILEDDAHNIKYIKPDNQHYKELCKLVVSENGHSIEHVSPTIDNYAELCQIAVKNSPFALEDIPSKYKTYKLCKLAVETQFKEWYGQTSVLNKFVPSRFKDKIKQELNITESVDFNYFRML